MVKEKNFIRDLLRVTVHSMFVFFIRFDVHEFDEELENKLLKLAYDFMLLTLQFLSLFLEF